MRLVRVLTAAAVAAMTGTAVLEAQTGEQVREAQVRMLELQRRVLLTMADSMPERLYRDAATPVQRHFAAQIHHSAMVFTFLPRIMTGVQAPTGLPDTATAFGSRAGLRSYINAAYDYGIGVLRAQTPAQRAAEANLFGTRMPAWQVWDQLHQHTFWTSGQVVANFRKHGMAPPGFGFF